ncbi:hypothetical protein CAJAP_00936 [Camponotus japonicus]
MLQASPVDAKPDTDDNSLINILSNISSLLPTGQTANKYINSILEITQGVHLPCMIYSVVPWEFNCTRAEY